MNALLERLLADQQEETAPETAVDRFSRRHASLHLVDRARYRELIPKEAPRPGQQYAFEVDLDACTGCKACVTGCHSMNGLDENEVWRTVGLLHGGTAEAPVQQTVTTACHHCVEPACMIGCPVKAYDKDPITGIVKHLDDQCIGCQYCVFMCPYDAPKYNPARGIVRKCDLCSDRLAHGEAPACVQACPNEAIRVGVVEQAQAVEASSFLPGAPAPDDTLPTTTYRTRNELPRNLQPADFYAVGPERAHPPLAVMLVLTQLSVGAFAVELVQRRVLGGAGAGTLQAWVALALCLAALGASVLHLGRPRYAFRAVLGLKTSWLSREILTFSLFAALAAGYAASFGLEVSEHARDGWLALVAGSGAAGVFSSVMVYEATRRPSWRAWRVGPLFVFSTVILGCATVQLVDAFAGRASTHVGHALVAAALIKLAGEASSFGHLKSRRHTALKRRAILLSGDLQRTTLWRFACGVAGGVLVPLGVAQLDGFARAAAALIAFALVLTGELLERHLFFAAAPAPRMPGAQA
jgi:Fe-S-cluster-containing dehydrogenase component/DMSO reductase anchor subunit